VNNPKILLADDSVTIRKVVELTFADEGYDVVAVPDGDTAMQKFVESEPDLVIADVNMPGMGGYQLCEMIKGDESTRDIPVVLVVGSFEPFDVAEASRVGANYYFTKPFQSIREVVEKVADLIAAKDFSKVVPAGTEDIESLYNESIVDEDPMPVDEELASSFTAIHETGEIDLVSDSYRHNAGETEIADREISSNESVPVKMLNAELASYKEREIGSVDDTSANEQTAEDRVDVSPGYRFERLGRGPMLSGDISETDTPEVSDIADRTTSFEASDNIDDDELFNSVILKRSESDISVSRTESEVELAPNSVKLAEIDVDERQNTDLEVHGSTEHREPRYFEINNEFSDELIDKLPLRDDHEPEDPAIHDTNPMDELESFGDVENDGALAENTANAGDPSKDAAISTTFAGIFDDIESDDPGIEATHFMPVAVASDEPQAATETELSTVADEVSSDKAGSSYFSPQYLQLCHIDPFETVAAEHVPAEIGQEQLVKEIDDADASIAETPAFPEAAKPAPNIELVEEIVQRVLDRLSDKAVREVAMEAVPRIAEKLIREAVYDQPIETKEQKDH